MYLPLCSTLNESMPLCQMAQYIGAPLLYGGSRVMMPYYYPQMYMQPCSYCPYAMQQKNNPGPSTKYGEEFPQYYEGDYTGIYQPYPVPGYPPGQFGGPHGLPIRSNEAPSETEESQKSIYNHVEKEEVNKDDFIPGYVPNHNHGSVDYTSLVDGHVHQCLDITFPPTLLKDGTHVHYTEGYVLFEDGHNHHYKSWSGPAIPVNNGMHVHYYDFYTTESDGHRHRASGVDMPAPGTI